MASTVADKLKIKPGFTLMTMNAPDSFELGLAPLPKLVNLTRTGNKFDQVHWFVQSRKQLEKEMSRVMKMLKPGVTVWVYYPKGSSGIQTDLTRDKGWECLLAEGEKLSWISLISFDKTWSVFGFRAKTDADKKKDSSPKPEREIFQWVNPQTKTVRLPKDLSTPLSKKKKELAFFDSLSFTNKKEYIEWVIMAKRPETRIERIKGTLERLAKGWKNPRNM